MSVRLGSLAAVLAIAMTSGASALAQEVKPSPGGVDPARVDDAIEKGIAFLKAGTRPPSAPALPPSTAATSSSS